MYAPNIDQPPQSCDSGGQLYIPKIDHIPARVTTAPKIISKPAKSFFVLLVMEDTLRLESDSRHCIV